MNTTPNTSSATASTTWMRRYTIDPELADEFATFVTGQVLPARAAFGFQIGSVWISTDRTEFTWFVTFDGDEEEFAAKEKAWEESPERAEVFAGKPKYVLGKSLGPVTQLL